jgi:diguanylate cyclase (GGDEF)-like protein
MQESLNRFVDQKTSLTLLMIDVDHFKQLNDRFGHPVGDRVLRLVAGVLKDQFQNRGCVCRYGGDEFSVVISGATCEQLVEVADGVLIAVSQSPMIIDGNEIRVTCSAGMAQFMINDDIEAVIGRADAALYQSKNRGRNCIHWHDGQRIRPATEDRP